MDFCGFKRYKMLPTMCDKSRKVDIPAEPFSINLSCSVENACSCDLWMCVLINEKTMTEKSCDCVSSPNVEDFFQQSVAWHTNKSVQEKRIL